MQKVQSEFIRIFNNKFAFFSGLLILAFFILQNINERFFLHDFEVYYGASRNFLHGQPVYGPSFGLGTGVYKYSPLALFLFAPLAILPFGMAKVIYYFFLSGLSVGTFVFLFQMIERIFFPKDQLSLSNKLLFLSVLICGASLYRELHMGNVNMILLFIFSIAFFFLSVKSEFAAGILLGLGILIKPHFLVLLPLLLVRKRSKLVFVVVVSILVGLLLPIFFVGIHETLNLTMEWKNVMVMHYTDTIEFPDTIYSWLSRIGTGNVHQKAGALFTLVVLSTVAILFLLLTLSHLRKEKKHTIPAYSLQNFTFEYFFLIALIPNITYTDTEHFLLALPLILFILLYLQHDPKRKMILLLSIIAFVFYGGNLGDLIGRDLAHWMTEHGMTGLGNLMILCVSLIIYQRYMTTNNKIIPATN